MKTLFRGALTVAAVMTATVAATVAVTLPATPANAEPATPAFGSAIEGYQPSDPATGCDPTDKPGPRDLANVLNAVYGTKPTGIARPCTSDVSEHEEGRALDWVVSGEVDTAANAEQQATAQRVIDWLLATDEYGNRHAMFRRLGLMYIIWNKQIWAGYRADEGWRPDSCSGVRLCHQDHIHFSFSRAGANRNTSWWTDRLPIAPATAGTVGPVRYNNLLRVFVRGINNRLYQQIWTGRAWESQDLGGAITSGPSAVVEGTFLRVFARGTDNALWVNSYNGQSWTWWRIGGVMHSEPSAILWGGTLRVFYRGANGGLYQAFYENGWTIQPLGFGLQSGPSAVNDNGNLRVFARGNDGALWRINWESPNWRADRVGGVITSSPGALMQGSQVFVFARGGDGALWRYSWSSSGGWATVEVGGSLVGGPQAILDGSVPRVFMRANDGQLRQAFWQNSTWNWQYLGGSLA